MQEIGINVVFYETYDATTNDLSSLILKLKSINPDILAATSYINDSVLFVKAVSGSGLYTYDYGFLQGMQPMIFEMLWEPK